MTVAARVVEIAQSWIGTPYVHQASCKMAGCDCLGLIRGVWRGLYGAEPQDIPAYSWDWSEPQGHEDLWDALSSYMRPKPRECSDAGDVLLFRMRPSSVAKHLGIQAGTPKATTFIHSYTGHGVIETSLTNPWSRRIVARFSFPDEVI